MPHKNLHGHGEAGLALNKFLTRLIWICVLPLVLLSAYLAFSHVKQVQNERNVEARHLTMALATAIDDELNARIRALNLLAMSPLVKNPPRWKELYQEALGFKDSFGSNVIVADRQQHMLFNTRVPYGTVLPPLPQPKGQNAALNALQTGQPAVGTIFHGPVSNESMIAIAVPGLREGKLDFLVITPIEASYFKTQLLDQVTLPAGWSLRLVDGNGDAIARREPPGFASSSADDAARHFSVKSQASPWSVVLEIPGDIYLAPLIKAAVELAISVLAATLIGFLGGQWAGRQLASSVASLGEPRTNKAPPLHITEISNVRHQTNVMNEELELHRQNLTKLVISRTAELSAALADSSALSERLQHEIIEHQQTTAHLQQALKGAGAGSYEWQIETGETSWSSEVWALNGLTPEAGPVNYATWRHSVFPDDLEALERITFDAVSQRAEIEVEWRVNLPPDVPPRWLMSRAQPLPEPDGQLLRYRGIIIDITKRRQAELTLELYRAHLEELVTLRTTELTDSEAEQKRLNRALRLLSDCNTAVIHAKSEGQLLNDLCRLAVESGGYLMSWVGIAEENVEKTVRLVAKFADEDGYLERLQVSWNGEQSLGQGPTGTALRVGTTQVIQNSHQSPNMLVWREAILKRGYQSCVALPLVSDNQILGALTLFSLAPNAFAQDEVNLLEELARNMAYGLQSQRTNSQLGHYQQQLERRVKERTQDIDTLNIELHAKANDADTANLAKGAFLASMSHELRTPLNAVIGLTGLLADSPLGRRQRDYADKIQLSAHALRVLIDDILDFSKIDAGELRLENAFFSLNAVLRTTASVLGVSLRDKPIEALFDIAPAVPDTMIGDALRLQQILLNLTSNAVKFTESGEVVVGVRCLAREATQVRLQFSVRDTGIGIAHDKLSDIFDGFTQANASTSRLYGGSGLGLAISARLASLMGGVISVDSTLDSGSEFLFDVTMALGVSEVLPEASTLPTALSILIVDDHALTRVLLTKACTALGWTVHAVDSGVAALDELRLNTTEGRDYDLMLLDWRMPGMDGLEMLRQVNASTDIGLPLVVLMASIFELELAVAASDDLYLDGIAAKPLTPVGLLEAVNRAYAGDFSDVVPTLGKSDKRLVGKRLLVAEDNELNREVIEQMLTRAGAEVVMVVNGLAAVTALRLPGACFDAVLMDIQMPVMDGYTATRMIREELGLVDLPIIAVTALVRPEDREKSRQVGMVGHIVKPINVEDLLDIVAKERRSVETVPAIPVESLAGLNMAMALNDFGGSAKQYSEILQKFLVHHAKDVSETRRLFNLQDIDGATGLVHGLSGVASLLHASEVARLASAADQALLGGRLERIPSLLDELDAAMITLTDSITQLDVLCADA